MGDMKLCIGLAIAVTLVYFTRYLDLGVSRAVVWEVFLVSVLAVIGLRDLFRVRRQHGNQGTDFDVIFWSDTH